MSLVLRCLLIIVSLFCCIWIISKIRKAKARIEDSLFWFFFAIILIVLSVFPEVAIWLTNLIGIESPVNLVFLVIIFILIVRIFTLTLRLATLENKFQNLAQQYAIDCQKKEK